MSSISRQLNKDKLDQDEFWQAAKNARSFGELVTALKRFQGSQPTALLRTMFTKCLAFTGSGFVLTDDDAMWRRILAALPHYDGILFVFDNGLLIHFRQDKSGKVYMHIFTAGEGSA
jgi:hypothetical protein